MTDLPEPSLATTCVGRGRALRVDADGTLYRSLHLAVLRSRDDGASWQPLLSIPRPLKRRLIEPSRMLCRLLRHEVRALVTLSDGSHAAATRRGVWFAGPGETQMRAASIDAGATPAALPTTLTRLDDDRIVWGEYWGNRDRRAVRLFVSEDRGRTYRPAFEFPAGQVKHVHNLIPDPSLGRVWVLVGDYGEEPGMGLLAPDFSDFRWVVRGEQKYRAVWFFDMGDHLIYGSDTEAEPAAVYRLDKASARVERIAGVDGSCIYACRCGPWLAISTTAEPNPIGRPMVASLWLSRDGDRWQRVLTRPKDRWLPKYFQFGSLVLAQGRSDRPVLMFSGQALSGVDGKAYVARLGEA